MNTFEQIVREEIRSVITSIVRTELAKLTGNAVSNDVEVKRPGGRKRSKSGGRKRSKLTVQLAELQPNWSINVTPRRLKQAQNSTRYLARKFGMCFQIRQYGDGYRIRCIQAMPNSNLEQVNG